MEKGLSKASQHLATPTLGLIKSAGPVRFLVLGTGIEELNTCSQKQGPRGEDMVRGVSHNHRYSQEGVMRGQGKLGRGPWAERIERIPQGEARAPQADRGLCVSEAVQQPGSGPAPVTDSVRAPDSTVLILVTGLLW